MAWYERDYNREDAGPMSMGRRPAMSVTTRLLIINCVVFVLDGVTRGSSRGDWLSPSRHGAFSIEQAVYGLQLWRWFTYQFLHADLMHLVFNMIGLYFFGRLMENWWGKRRFLVFYLLCGMSGALLFTLLAYMPGLLAVAPRTSLVGASGSIFGILVGCALLYPHQRVMLMFPPIPMSMRTMALVFLGISVASLAFGACGAGGAAAHLGGAALGLLLVRHPRLLGFADRSGGSVLGQARLRRQQGRARQARHREAHEAVEVDRILDKVREHGLHSLSGREKRALKRATDRKRRAG